LNLISRQSDGRGQLPDFSLVFPTYNPGSRLRHTLAELADFLAVAPDCWELVFICDGCTDDTQAQLQSWKPIRGSVRIFSYTPNRGKGYAVRQGLLAASAPYRIFTDIDLAYPFRDIERVARVLRSGSDVVIGSRAHRDSIVELPSNLLGYAYRRYVQSRIFGLLVRALLPLNQNDTQAGLKGFSERAVRMTVPRITCDGFGFDCELLTACVRLGLAISEVPVHVRYESGGSTTNFRSTMRMVEELWRIRRAWPAAIEKSPSIESPRYREAG